GCSCLWNDREQQVRGPIGVPIDLVGHRLTAADMIGNVFYASHCAGSVGRVHAGDFQANAMTRLELVRGREYLDPIFDDFSWSDGSYRFACQLVEGLPRF